MIIRTATENDLPDILRLYSQPGMDDGKVLTSDSAEDIFAKMKTYPDYSVYVAEVDGKVVGTFGLLIMDNLAHMGSKSAVVEDVVVSPSSQRKGVGKRMMQYAMEVSQAKSCYKVSLSSNVKRKDAHELYKNLGFKIHGYSFLVELE